MTNYLKPVEQKIINGTIFNVFKSLNNKYIQKVDTNEIYSEAVDLASLKNKYIETNIDITTQILDVYVLLKEKNTSIE